MAENMFSPQQKAVSDEYRQNYDRIEWARDYPDILYEARMIHAEILNDGMRGVDHAA